MLLIMASGSDLGRKKVPKDSFRSEYGGMFALMIVFPLCFLIMVACRLLLPTPFMELARLGVVWMSIVGAVIALAYYWGATLWPLIVLFAAPVALIHTGYVLVSFWKSRSAS